ncbi:unnamed protein product [Symbiodinium natans]|uniref:Uncharacterized protein n=1 Tax=Symbiodinium natans TaxID=878477 RepID=A0A812JH27_9DINO|nr:unnamed protein product [Symbiodinium natans]
MTPRFIVGTLIAGTSLSLMGCGGCNQDALTTCAQTYNSDPTISSGTDAVCKTWEAYTTCVKDAGCCDSSIETEGTSKAWKEYLDSLLTMKDTLCTGNNVVSNKCCSERQHLRVLSLLSIVFPVHSYGPLLRLVPAAIYFVEMFCSCRASRTGMPIRIRKADPFNEEYGLAGRVQETLREGFALTSETLKVLVDSECSSEEQESKARRLSTAYAANLASVRQELLAAIDAATEVGEEEVANQVAQEVRRWACPSLFPECLM